MGRSFLERPFFEDRHRQIAHDLGEFARTDLTDLAGAAHKDDNDLDSTCREIVSRLGRADFPEARCRLDSDQAMDVRRLRLSREILARHDGLLDFAFAIQGLGTEPISLFGSGKQRQQYFPAVVRGERISVFARNEKCPGRAGISAFAVEADNPGLSITEQNQVIAKDFMNDITESTAS